jgi:hypothetical protein
MAVMEVEVKVDMGHSMVVPVGRMVSRCSVLIKVRWGNELKPGASEEMLLPLLYVCEVKKALEKVRKRVCMSYDIDKVR